jgi:hypothetical protein
MRDKTMKVFSWPCLLAVMCLFVSSIASSVTAQDKVTPKEARAIAKEAYIFNYSLVMMYRTMYIQAIDTESESYRGGFGKWLHLGTTKSESQLVTGISVEYLPMCSPQNILVSQQHICVFLLLSWPSLGH